MQHRFRLLVLAKVLLGSPALAAQERDPQPAAHPAPGDFAAHAHSPYAREESREIKALSAREIEDLLAGEGMGLALAAELNGVPGPKHALELADRLGLTDEQRRRIELVQAGMREAARALGRRIVEEERSLDRPLATGEITPAEIESRTARIADLAGRLRAVHLTAHLETAAVLGDEQRRRYRELRGYLPADGVTSFGPASCRWGGTRSS